MILMLMLEKKWHFKLNFHKFKSLKTVGELEVLEKSLNFVSGVLRAIGSRG